ncbi:ferritin [bacterium]
MMKAKMQKALNKQINEELFSYYLYLSMSTHFQSVNLLGVSNWFYVQAQEEMTHAMRMFHFISERGGKVNLLAIKAPATEWESPLEAFEAAYGHECHITECINKLVDLAIQEKDHATNAFLQWFVNEQVEEEASADEIVQKMKMVDGNPSGLYMADQELAARVFAPPADMTPGQTGAAGL